MHRGFGYVAALAIGLAAWSSVSASQDCTASLPQPPPGWTTLPLHAASKSTLKVVLALNCRDCAPELWVEVGTGPANASMRAGPKGVAWAQEAATAPNARAQLLAGLLASTRAGNPECLVQADIDGVTLVGAASFVAMRTRMKCPPAETETTIVSYTTFDGRCLNDVAVVWKNAANLTPQTMSRVYDLLAGLKFGP